MNARHTGTYEELQAKLAGIAGEWRDLNPNQKQFRAKAGGIVNWYPTTGALLFQGKSPSIETLTAAVMTAVKGEAAQAATVAVAAGDGPTPVGPIVRAEAAAAPGHAPVRTEPCPESSSSQPTLQKPFVESELVFGLIGAVGSDLRKVQGKLEERLKLYGYEVKVVRVTEDVIPVIVKPNATPKDDEGARIWELMNAGNEARRLSGHNGVLALGSAARINSLRPKQDNVPRPAPKRAYIISSLKHPKEVQELREIYPLGFYLIGVHSDEKRRFKNLTENKGVKEEMAEKLIRRDEEEAETYGQKVTATFHLSDFFVQINGQDDDLHNSLVRILDLLFGCPFITPTFDEYAMFLAFSASLRSADLSRQVGAVVAIHDQVVATGANDCPKAGGGLYWPKHNETTHKIEDEEDGRDYMRGEDSNRIEQQRIVDNIIDVIQKKNKQGKRQPIDEAMLRAALEETRISDLTEFGRVVHAEMEALLSCARARIPTQDGILYSTTFPCHNCAKHIVAAGIKRVVYIEPYQKSKAAEFHTDSIKVGLPESDPAPGDRPMVQFEPFVGVGPRRFFDLFSMRLGSGYPLTRKKSTGHTEDWEPKMGRLRLQMIPKSYLELEADASDAFLEACDKIKE